MLIKNIKTGVIKDIDYIYADRLILAGTHEKYVHIKNDFSDKIFINDENGDPVDVTDMDKRSKEYKRLVELNKK